LTNKLSKNGYFKAQNILFTKCLWYFIAKAFPPPKKRERKKEREKIEICCLPGHCVAVAGGADVWQ